MNLTAVHTFDDLLEGFTGPKEVILMSAVYYSKRNKAESVRGKDTTGVDQAKAP